VSDGFLVDLPSLGQTIDALSEAAERMRVAGGTLGTAGVADLGSASLEGAAKAFQDRWEYGIGKISDAAATMTEELRETKQLYEHIDHGVATLFRDPDATAECLGVPPEPGEPSPISRALGGKVLP
jgi:hypothetical protein